MDVYACVLTALCVEIPFFYFFFYHEFADLKYARTEMFFLFIIVEMIIVLNFRSIKYSIFKVLPHKWLLMAIVWELVLIAVLIQFSVIRDAFGIDVPSLSMISKIVGVGIVVFISMEVRKLIVEKKMQVRREIAKVQW